MKNVLVTGSFDLLHSGHIYFFERASAYGRVYVGIGSDKSINQLKQRLTVNKQDERLYMVQSIKYVTKAWINTGVGLFDFFNDVPDYIDALIVNEDQDFPEKYEFCAKRGMEYIILKRTPREGLPVHSSTQQRKFNVI
jgi:cytidyltransferase-like protein